MVKELRELIVFAPQDLTSDPPFSKLDLISCRNLLIYLDQSVQKKIIQLFHFALREGGYLFLGTAETISGQENLFEPVSQKWRIYRKLGVADAGGPGPAAAAGGASRPSPIPAAGPAPADAAGHRAARPSPSGSRRAPRWSTARARCCTARRRRGLPADARRASRPACWPMPPAKGLRNRLAAGVCSRPSARTRRSRSRRRVKKDRKSVPVKVTVSPLRHPREADGLLLVTFEEQKAARRRSRRPRASRRIPMSASSRTN